MTDTQMGIISGPAFSIIYASCALPIAKLSDRATRKYIIAVAVALWSAFTSLGGAAHSFIAFMLSRSGVAFGESALSPAAHSIFADYFPEHKRFKVLSIYSCGIALGSFIALTLGGYLSDHFGWRSALYLVGASGFALALLVLLTVREPVREPTSSGGHKSDGGLVALLADPAIRNTVLGAGILSVANGSMSAWVPAYIMRTFGLSASATGASYGALSGSLAVAGTLAGGLLAGWLSRRDRRYGFRLLAVAFLFATAAKLISLTLQNYGAFLAFTATSGLLVLFYPGPTFATIQSLAKPSSRSFASAVTLFAINGVGIAGGAFVTGWLSDRLAPTFGPDSLRWSLGILSLTSAWAAFHYWRASQHLAARQPTRPVSD